MTNSNKLHKEQGINTNGEKLAKYNKPKIKLIESNQKEITVKLLC